MAHLLKLPNDSAGYDADAYTLTLPKNTASVIYLVAADGLAPIVTDAAGDAPSDLVAMTTDDRGVTALHKDKRLDEWERAQSLKRIVMRSGGKPGQARLRALTAEGADFIKPLPIFVVEDRYGRRSCDTVTVEPAFAKELATMKVREAIARVARDQMTSHVHNQDQALDAFHHPYKTPGDLMWCGTFVAYCWNLLAKLRNDVPANLFGTGEALRSPQKAIAWAMDNPGQFKLLRYAGANPMTGKGKVAYADIGDEGVTPQPGDVVLWYNKSGYKNDDEKIGAPGFKHVSLLESFSGESFTDINGNAWDADAQSIFARIEHATGDKTTKSKTPRAMFLCIRGL